MDWSVEMEAKEAMLRRIVAMLYSLSNLAEQAAGRSPAIRHLVLFFLRPAEALTREMVIRDSQQFGVAVPELVADWTGDNAMRLARRFRALALTLESLVDVRIAGRQAGADLLGALRQATRTLRSLLDCIAGRFEPVIQPDTS